MKLKLFLQFSVLLVVIFHFSGCKKKCHEISPSTSSPDKDNLIKTWESITTPYSGILYRVDFLNSSIGYICGSGGLILKTTDGGTTFSQLTSGTVQDLANLDFVDVNIGYVGGNGGTLLKTINGGQSWISLSIGSNKVRGMYFFQ